MAWLQFPSIEKGGEKEMPSFRKGEPKKGEKEKDLSFLGRKMKSNCQQSAVPENAKRGGRVIPSLQRKEGPTFSSMFRNRLVGRKKRQHTTKKKKSVRSLSEKKRPKENIVKGKRFFLLFIKKREGKSNERSIPLLPRRK